MANIPFLLESKFNLNPLLQQTLHLPPLRSPAITLSYGGNNAFKLNYSSCKVIRYSPRLRIKCFLMNPKPKGDYDIGGNGCLEDNDLKAIAISNGVVNEVLWTSTQNFLKALKFPVITGILVVLLFLYDHHHDCVALAASGGRMGGSTFSSSSSSTRSEPSYSSSSSSSESPSSSSWSSSSSESPSSSSSWSSSSSESPSSWSSSSSTWSEPSYSSSSSYSSERPSSWSSSSSTWSEPSYSSSSSYSSESPEESSSWYSSQTSYEDCPSGSEVVSGGEVVFLVIFMIAFFFFMEILSRATEKTSGRKNQETSVVKPQKTSVPKPQKTSVVKPQETSVLKPRETSVVKPPATSVLMLQVGLLGMARSLQEDLNRIAETADTSSPEGLNYILQETTLAMLRHPDYCISAYSSVDAKTNIEEVEKLFNQFAIEERAKFDEETLVNVNNIKRQSTTTQKSNDLRNEYIVITIIVAAEGLHKLPLINSSAKLKEALQNLATIPPSRVKAVEVLWTPQNENDTLTEREYLEDYALLRPL